MLRMTGFDAQDGTGDVLKGKFCTVGLLAGNITALPLNRPE
jgi:hypothetical protein